jgi:hypothetical protein
MTCGVIVRAAKWPPKHPGATWDYAVDFEEACVRTWSPITDFGAGARIRVFTGGKAVGFEFEPTTPGRSGLRMPAFKAGIGETTPDGSIVWTCRALSSASVLRTIDSIVWDVDPDVTVTNESVVGFKALAKQGGGTDGEDYTVTVTATMSDGLVVPQVVILPVRVPVKVC